MKTTNKTTEKIGVIGNPSNKSMCAIMVGMFLSNEIEVAQYQYMNLYNSMKAFNGKKEVEKMTDLIIDTIWEMVGDKHGLKTSEVFNKIVIDPVMKYNAEKHNVYHK